jgi:hypothetical protein
MKCRLLLCSVLFLSFSSALHGQANSGTFALTGSMSVQREQATATLITGCNCPADGKVLVAGGVIDGLTFTTNTAELYDPATGQFVPTGTMNVPRGGHVAALLPGGKVLVVGAFDSPGPEDAEIYDPVTGTFSCVAGSDPVPRQNLVRAEMSRFLVAMGEKGAGRLPLTTPARPARIYQG